MNASTERNHWTSVDGRDISCRNICISEGHAELLNNDFRQGQKSIMEFSSKAHYEISFNMKEISTRRLGFWSKKMKKRQIRTEYDKFQIGLNDLSDDIRLNLGQGFCDYLFNSTKIDLYSLAEVLGISYPFVCQLKRQLYSIPIWIVKKLSTMSNIPVEEIEKNIVGIKSRAGVEINIKLPIQGNFKIASLVGHVFGDGYIGAKKKQFEYCNDNPNLINEVKKSIFSVFGIEPYTERKNRIGYPVVLGEILHKFGAPLAPKIDSKLVIPEWITNREEYFVAFTKAFFDDDGSVLYSQKYNAKGVRLYIIRNADSISSAFEILNQIKDILQRLDIYCGEPKIERKYLKTNEYHYVVYLNITDYSSILNYHKKIGLTSGYKKEKLTTICNRRMRYSKGDERKIRLIVFDVFSDNNILSTNEISNITGINNTKIFRVLRNLEKKKKVCVVGRIANNRSFLWKKHKEENDVKDKPKKVLVLGSGAHRV
jgi:hypothetical protein